MNTTAARPVPRLVGVGVGPGDPELITVKGARILREAATVVVPISARGRAGRAEATVLANTDAERIVRIVFGMDAENSAGWVESWRAAADAVEAAFAAGGAMVAFATIGDPNVYSTFAYLAATVRQRRPEVEIATVPGITAMQDLAARSGTVLTEGGQGLTLLPVAGGRRGTDAVIAEVDRALQANRTVVVYKGGRHITALLDLLRSRDRIDRAVLGVHLGLPDEQIVPAAEFDGDRVPYLSTLLIPAMRTDVYGETVSAGESGAAGVSSTTGESR